MPSEKPVKPSPRRGAKYVIQPLERRRALRAEFAKPFPSEMNALLKMNYGSIESFSRAEKLAFLFRKKQELMTYCRSVSNKKGRFALSEEALKHLDDKGLNIIVRELAFSLLKQNEKRLNDAWRKSVEAYLKSRGFPIEREVVSWTANEFFLGAIRTNNYQLDWRGLERVYIENIKMRRDVDEYRAQEMNEFYGKNTKGMRLSANQKRAARRWVRANYEKYREHESDLHRRVARKEIDFETMIRLGGEALAKLVERFKKEVLDPFERKEKEGMKKVGSKVEIPKKTGSRVERMVAYSQEARKERERVSVIREKERVAHSRGEKFNPTQYCLAEIAKENVDSANLFHGLMVRRQLSSGAIERLFTAGSLAQRVLKEALKNTDFVDRFGGRKIETLARWLSFVGPKGKLIARAQKAFGDKRGEEIFSFLERNRLIETQHGGGNVVYLRRFGGEK